LWIRLSDSEEYHKLEDQILRNIISYKIRF
ncbi:hypothetical protein A2U01_0040895, partial [Trifolium medium]|nr:hypothetical protein [Trifolium medium]